MSIYKEMYLKMVRASEKAKNVIIDAQQDCEEMYISIPNPEIKLVEMRKEAESEE